MSGPVGVHLRTVQIPIDRRTDFDGEPLALEAALHGEVNAEKRIDAFAALEIGIRGLHRTHDHRIVTVDPARGTGGPRR
ncbi:MAG: hypothetical protein AAGE05_06415 [Pseudomonadota bacterium]